MTRQSRIPMAGPRRPGAIRRTGVWAMLTVLALAVPASTSQAAAPGNPLIKGVNGPRQWLHDYGQGRELARELGLPLIVHFHASWCGPCRQMERETLASKQLLGQFGNQILGVKVDSDEKPGLVEAFHVDALPCDIVIAPDGLIVERNSGYQARSQYLTMVTRMSGRFTDERAAAIARLQAPTPSLPTAKPSQPATRPKPQPIVPDSRNLAANPPQTSRKKRPESRQETTRPRPVAQPSTIPPTEAANTPLVGLDGYCPVHIKTRREWIKGNPQFSTTWQGVVYNFASAVDLKAFQSAPQKYAPRMLGCDPVELWTTERAVQGSVEYGAFFNGDLFLFVSAASRNQFKVAPDRYVQLRHAFRADDVIGTRLR